MANQKLNHNRISPTKEYSVDELCSKFISARYERNKGLGHDIFFKKSGVANLFYVIYRVEEDNEENCYYLALNGKTDNSKPVEIRLKLFVRGRTVEKAERRLMALFESKEYLFNEVPEKYRDQIDMYNWRFDKL